MHLSDLMAQLGVEDFDLKMVKNVSFDDESLVKVKKDGEDWTLTSLKAFKTEQKLTVEMVDGSKIEVKVTDADNSYDFSKYVDSIVVQKKENGEWKTATEFTDGDSVRFKIVYGADSGTFPKGAVLTYKINGAGTNLTDLKLPEGSSGVIKQGKDNVGTYTIAEDGTITITLNEDFDTSKGFDGVLTFEGTVHNTKESGDDKYNIGGSTTITVKPKTQEENHDISLHKEGWQDESNKNKYYFKVTASSTNGTGGSYTFDDQITDIYPDKVTVSQATVYKNRQYVGTYDFSHNSGNDWITTLPELGAGESYDIYYDVTVDEQSGYAEGPGGRRTISNQSIAENQWSNKVTITNREPYVEKSVSKNDTTGKFTWTITINNPDGHDLSKDTFKDKIEITQGEAGSVTLPSSFTVHPVDGGSDFTVTVNSDGTFKFPSGSTGSKYTITYTTDYPTGNAGAEVKINNTIYDTPDGGNKTYENGSQGTGVIKDFNVGKTVYTNNISSEGNIFTIPWGGNIALPNSKYYSSDLSKLTFKDTMTTSQDGNEITGVHYTTAKQLKSTLSLIPYLGEGLGNNGYGEQLVWGTDYEVQTLDGKTITDTDSEDHIYGFRIVFKDAALNKIKDAKNITYYYSSYADFSDQASKTTWKFINAAAIPGHNTSAEYDYTKPREEKDFMKESSATGSRDTFSEAGTKVEYKDGKIYYRIIFTVPDNADGDLTLTDILPKGLSIDESSYHATFYLGDYDSDTKNDSRLNVNNYFTQSKPETLSDGKTKIVFTIKKGEYQQDQYDAKKYSYQPGDKIAITYTATIDDSDYWNDQKNVSKVYENEITFNGDTTSSKTEVDRSTKTLDKQAQLLSNKDGVAEIEYNVSVNPKGDYLNPSGDTVKLEDTLSIDKNDTEAHFVAESLNVYAFDASKPNNQGAKIDSNRYTYTYDTATNKLTLTLPDGLACVVNYKYSFVIGDTDPTITNKASLQGLDVNANDNNTKITNSSTSAYVLRQEMYAYKVDADNNKIRLSGVQFKLEKYDSTNANKWVEVTPRTHSLTTDSNGQLFFSKRDDGLETGVLYRLTEINVGDENKANGYQMSSKPYYFMWVPVGDESKSNHDIYQSSSASDSNLESSIQFIRRTGNMFIPNEKKAITVNKVWLNSDNTDLNDSSKTATVTLWRKYTHNVTKDQQKVNVSVTFKDAQGTEATLTVPVNANDETARVYIVKYYSAWGSELYLNGSALNKDTYYFPGGHEDNVAYIPIGSIDHDMSYTLTTNSSLSWDWIDAYINKQSTVYLGATGKDASTIQEDVDEPAEDANGNVYPAVTLKSGTNWSHVWTDLPANDSDGNKYYYYIKEEAVDGFTTTVTNNDGIERGTITVTNKSDNKVQYSSFSFNKQWIGVDGNAKNNWKKDITVVLTGKTSAGTEITSKFVITKNTDGSFTATESAVTGKTEITSYTFVPGSSSEGTFNFEFQNLPYADSKGNQYTYSLTEISVDGYKTEYFDSNDKSLQDQGSGISNNETVKNVEEGGYELPSTGSTGIERYLGIGAALMSAALVLAYILTYIERRRE